MHSTYPRHALCKWVPGHLWDANRRNWGNGSLPKDAAEYKERYILSLDQLNELQRQGIAAVAVSTANWLPAAAG